MKTQQTDAARQIVAMLMVRARWARARLMEALASEAPESQIDSLTLQWTEAGNAAECARRVLYEIPL